MNKKIISALFVCLFLVFVGVMDYPFIAQWFNEIKQSEVAVNYLDSINDLNIKEKEQYLADARAYNQTLVTGGSVNFAVPFSDSATQDSTYTNLLNMHEEGVMGVIQIPKINLSLPIYHGTSNEVLEKGAGHMEGSALPVGGENTHACIAAHRGLPSKKLFTNLDQIVVGDLFYLEVLGEKMAYEVYEVEVVTPENIEPLKIEAGKDLVTLITCTPYGVNTHRIYVHGTRIPYEETSVQVTELEVNWLNDWWIILTVVLLVWMCVLLYWFNRKPKNKGAKQ